VAKKSQRYLRDFSLPPRSSLSSLFWDVTQSMLAIVGDQYVNRYQYICYLCSKVPTTGPYSAPTTAFYPVACTDNVIMSPVYGKILK